MSKESVRGKNKGKPEIPADTFPSYTGMKRKPRSVADPAETGTDYLGLFLQSRRAIEVTPGSLTYYKVKLRRFMTDVDVDAARERDIECFLVQFSNPGNRHAYYRAIKTFYNWRERVFGFPSPMKKMSAPRLAKLILPSLDREQVLILIEHAQNIRDKAIISLFTESGLRLSELENISPEEIDWNRHVVRVIGKGRKEGFAPFGERTGKYLKEWLSQCKPAGNIWGINRWGIVSMLRRLEKETGIKCNSHTFRRSFACLLRKAGVDVLTIKDLGRWESLEMVQRYTRSVNFDDSMKFYKAPLS
jgi:integrase